MNEFSITLSKSQRDRCELCNKRISTNMMKIIRKTFESEDSWKTGPTDKCFHVQCFTNIRTKFQFYDSGLTFDGAENLEKEDLESLKKSLPKIESTADPHTININEFELQNKNMFSIRNELKKLDKPTLLKILEDNEQYIPPTMDQILDNLTDIMSFGALNLCPECKEGKLTLTCRMEYVCTFVGQWATCTYTTAMPLRKTFIMPTCLPFSLPLEPTLAQKIKPRKILENLEFVVTGSNMLPIAQKIEKLGGEIKQDITDATTAVICSEQDFEKKINKIQLAEKLKIDVVPKSIIDDFQKAQNTPKTCIKQKALSSWGSEITDRLKKKISRTCESLTDESNQFTPSKEGLKTNVRIKGGGIVDPEFYGRKYYHVYREGKNKYTVTLGITDIGTNKNNFYKLQILKPDNYNENYSDYILLRKWGKIGGLSQIKTDAFKNLRKCISQFEARYEHKTGNTWENRNNFKKLPAMMYHIEEDYFGEDEILFNHEVESKLPKEIQDLIEFIVDINSMSEVLTSYEIDSNKLPLGKLSKTQIDQAYGVLSDLVKEIESDNRSSHKITSYSNRFYTLIPHHFGKTRPKLLDNLDDIQKKSRMLDSLRDIECAYALYHNKYNKDQNFLDTRYLSLNTDIIVLNKNCDEYSVIKKYVRNTQGRTHNFELRIVDVFVIDRHGETEKYLKNSDNIPNKMLLWHGSRRTNFASIIMNGLKIAPPEAPHTGYMFGKGIYFSDVVTKAANYCQALNGETGLLLLCEVALGKSMLCTQAFYVNQLPPGYNSTMGLGRMGPDVQGNVCIKNVKIPSGRLIDTKTNTVLYYNEYIVYDPEQVRIKYLVMVKFKAKEVK